MRFVLKQMAAEGTHAAKVISVRVINEDTDKERVLINTTSEAGQIPVISYSEAGYDMLSQVCNHYGASSLDDLVGKEVVVKVEQATEYLNAKILTKKATQEEDATF